MVAIGIIGPAASGKHTIAMHLVISHRFQLLYLSTSQSVQNCKNIADSAVHFYNVDEAVYWMTSNWQTNLVILGIETRTQLRVFAGRPFFYALGVNAPYLERFNRRERNLSFEEFVVEQDGLMYKDDGLAILMSKAVLTICNNSSVKHLYTSLDKLDLSDETRTRPSWDLYFMSLATLASHRSNCMKRRVGAVLVCDRRVISTGYNGTARLTTNCLTGGCPRCNQNLARCGKDQSECLCLHAEENALLEAGVGRAQGGTIYVTMAPCLGCAKRLLQCGVKRVVYESEFSADHNSRALMETAGMAMDRFVLDDRTFISVEEMTRDVTECMNSLNMTNGNGILNKASA